MFIYFGRNRSARAIKNYRVDHQGNLWMKVCHICYDEYVLLTSYFFTREDEGVALEGFVVVQL